MFLRLNLFHLADAFNTSAADMLENSVANEAISHVATIFSAFLDNHNFIYRHGFTFKVFNVVCCIFVVLLYLLTHLLQPTYENIVTQRF